LILRTASAIEESFMLFFLGFQSKSAEIKIFGGLGFDLNITNELWRNVGRLPEV